MSNPFDQDKFNGGLDALLIARVGMLHLLSQDNPDDKQKAQAVMDDVWACSTVNGQINNIVNDEQRASLHDDVSLIDHLAEAMFYIRNKDDGMVKPENPLTVWVIKYLESTKEMWRLIGKREGIREALNDASIETALLNAD